MYLVFQQTDEYVYRENQKYTENKYKQKSNTRTIVIIEKNNRKTYRINTKYKTRTTTLNQLHYHICNI